MSINLNKLQKLKDSGEKIVALTAYDATFAQLESEAGVEVILVGDSLGMVMQGRTSTLPVTIEDMVYHTQCVARGNRQSEQPAMIMTDLPFMSYGTLEQGLASARAVMQAGAHIIKLEGDSWLMPLVESLAQQGTPTCVHLGLTPQSVNKLGGYKVQGRDESAAENMFNHAKALADAGADMLLLECVPSALGKRISQAVSIPVIGIGAGPDTDAQVLVMHDMLGLSSGYVPKFVKNFLADGRSIQEAFAAYAHEVKTGTFPTAEHEFDA